MLKCECGKQYEKGRALAMHKRYHCPLQGRKQSECDCEDGGTWALLNASHVNYYGHINPKTGNRYKKYCTECEEVI